MRTIKLTVRYDGTDYAGWQYQINATSVQEVIEAAIKKVTGRAARLIASSRTDAGVHAKAQIAHFKTATPLSCERIRCAINNNLPRDIVITRAEETGARFHAQRDARRKRYRYTICLGDFIDPLIRRYAVRCPYALNISMMRKAARMLEGKHDFKTFQTQDKIEKSSVRTIRHIGIVKKGKLIYIDLEADGFLRNMARRIVGTLVEVGRGKSTLARVREALKKKDGRLSGPNAPPQGLCLEKVWY